MNEFQLKYGTNPNQKPARIFMADGSDLPVTILNGKPGYINFLDAFNSYQLVRDLKKAGYGVYLLSNASCRQHEYWPRVPGSQYFDGTLISADVKQIKPCAEIYDTLYKTFRLVPRECLFIDDSAQNIEGAERTGMPGIVFHGDAEELRREMQAFGVQIP